LVNDYHISQFEKSFYSFLQVILLFATPCFIILSETLLGMRYSTKILQNFLLKRFKFILIHYALFCLFFIFIFFLFFFFFISICLFFFTFIISFGHSYLMYYSTAYLEFCDFYPLFSRTIILYWLFYFVVGFYFGKYYDTVIHFLKRHLVWLLLIWLLALSYM